MKITFISPPSLDGKPAADRLYGCAYSFYYLPHIPSLICATLLKNNGYKVELLDFPAQGKGIQAFMDYIKSTDTNIFVFYSVFLTKRTDLKAREIIRQSKPDAVFIYMGPYPTAFPYELIDMHEDTIVVMGEPEVTTVKLIRAIASRMDKSKIENIVFRSGKNIVYNQLGDFIQDINSLPIPDRRLLDHTPISIQR